MDLPALYLFLDVAQRGSFAAVARDRDIDASSVSRSIAALEAELGVRLFQRTTRAMTLTEAGEVFRERVASLLGDLARARDEMAALAGDAVGVVRLTASLAFGEARLVPLLPALREAFPRLALDLVLTDRNLDLVAERIDVAIRLGAGFGADVIGVKLFDTRYRVVASPDHPYAARRGADPRDFAGERCLLLALPDFRSRWRFRRDNEIIEVPVTGDIVISSPLALRSAACAGLGPALLASWLIDEDVASGRLVDLFPDYEAAAASFETAAWILYPSRSLLPLKARLVIDFLKAALATTYGEAAASARLK